MQNKQYSEEFKKEALRLMRTSGKRRGELEKEVGLSHGLLRKWAMRYEVNEGRDELELKEVERLKAELRQVKRELEVVRQEREILS